MPTISKGSPGGRFFACHVCKPVIAIIVCLVLTAFHSYVAANPRFTNPRSSLHRFEVKVLNGKGNPLQGATVTGTLYDHLARVIDTLLVTDADGEATFIMPAKADSSDEYENAFESKCEYGVSLPGYLSEFGTMRIRYVLTNLNQRGEKGLNEQSVTVTLKTTPDLMQPSLIAIPDTSLKNSLMRYLQAVHQQYAAQGIYLPLHSVYLDQTREGRLLELVLRTPNVLNLNAVDSAGMAKVLFELAGRGTLELIRDELPNLGPIDGLRIRISGEKKHFANTHEDPEPVECTFEIPKPAIQEIDSAAPNSRFFDRMKVSLDGVPIVVH